MKLIKDIDKAWKYASVQITLLGSAIIQVYWQWKGELKDVLTPDSMLVICAIFFAINLVVRLLDFKHES